MGRNNEIGARGEELACEALTKKGFDIVERNWRRGKNEVDIIAYKEGIIIFVEVKTRGNTDYGEPETFVDLAKQRAYVKMANAYVIENRRTEDVRFDVIAITNKPDGPELKHLENAFTAIEVNLTRRR
ncbi:MAG: YraN family protein [Bacteroidales bacterium]|nr:YraN family protein [Bacteroidales bacterium]